MTFDIKNYLFCLSMEEKYKIFKETGIWVQLEYRYDD